LMNFYSFRFYTPKKRGGNNKYFVEKFEILGGGGMGDFCNFIALNLF